MKTKIISLIVIIILFTACTKRDENDSVGNSTDGDNEIAKSIDLYFTPVESTLLKEGLPEEGWIIGRSIYFGDLPGQIESTLHLYVDSNEDNGRKPGEGVICGFLEHGDKLYELGDVGSFGFNDLDVLLEDRTYDGIREINIIGGMGATYVEMKVITYNEDSNEWENILTMGSPVIADLDRDGREELIAGSRGSVPSFVHIYKWNDNCFERADVCEATGNLYAFADTINGEWIIKTGVQGSEPTSYRYEAGKLIEFK